MAGLVDAVLKRQRILTLCLLGLLAVLSWMWLFSGAGMGMGPQFSFSPFPHNEPHDAMAMSTMPGLALTFSMWWTMMAAMMLPSAAPLILLHTRAARHRQPDGTTHTLTFIFGYLLVWGVFSGLATLAQWGLREAALISSMEMSSISRSLSALTLAAAGIYQISPLKRACLSKCRNPASFIAQHHRTGRLGVFRLGIIHGSFCVGCCWALMALLFVGGVMNIAWIVTLTFIVAAEKLLPAGRYIAIGSGVILLVWSAATVFP